MLLSREFLTGKDVQLLMEFPQQLLFGFISLGILGLISRRNRLLTRCFEGLIRLPIGCDKSPNSQTRLRLQN